MRIETFDPGPFRHTRRSQRGFMVITMMAILTMMLIFVAASMRSLTHLRQDLKLVEAKQIQRLEK